MAESSEIIFDKLVYSCAFEKYRGDEEFIPEHFLGFQMSGETHAFYADGNTVISENQIILVRKNQLIRTVKYPGKAGKYQFISISLDSETLRQYALQNKIIVENRNKNKQKLFFEPDEFLNAYFLSLGPYINRTKEATPKLANLKIMEAIELILQSNPDLKNVLFDFSEPYKIDLDDFMNQNYMFNVSVEAFAKLTGRSVSGFKRDFAKTFNTTPKQWLRERRLDEAMYRIKQKKEKPADFYLDLGFENLSHFYFTFKKKFGLTSSEI
ncbi:helix-turn-helix domain-containing protein [Pseudobacter ginsenosidimutans]|uniref:AraC-like DNA-binding protein n=1 Tax=Pseudobacter ginsenosidimutans TaxID=661488 RepID=A0A4Q7N6D1_9BACT|nr:AraC family transcriptional regulator [Pseudobacter ginsenosidimutans]QEC45144.1 helix-turn-helix transcriptional regulator [Pseudobacter ginsenosidimutans]RZS76641.1 AraC-like DNA-binding protein [Pseudobacter ginsenosidimutans]